MNLKIAKEDFIKFIKMYYKEVHGVDVDVTTLSYEDERTRMPDTIVYINYNVKTGNINATAKKVLRLDELFEIVRYSLPDEYDIKSLYLNTDSKLVGYGYGEHIELVFLGIDLEVIKKEIKEKRL